MAYEFILYEKTGKVARITLNRPEVLNALTEEMIRDIRQALDEAESGSLRKAFTA